MQGILGIKKGMTQVFDESGLVIPVTIIKAGPCVVTQIKTRDKDGYNSVQIAFSDKKENRATKPEKGHFAKANTRGLSVNLLFQIRKVLNLEQKLKLIALIRATLSE